MYLRIIIFLFSSLIACNTLYGQKGDRKIIVTGTVLDEKNDPVVQAEIFADDESTGNFTNYHGKFKVRVHPDAKIISAFSELKGYYASEINGQSDLVLKPDTSAADFPAVSPGTEGGGNLRSRGSKKINTYTDIYQMIRNEVPGVVVSGKSIVVQGPNSFFGSSQPLFVVNGVRVYNIDYLNPVEVKSIKLLKGSSANIYGNDGANGVIVIDLLGSAVKNNLKK